MGGSLIPVLSFLTPKQEFTSHEGFRLELLGARFQLLNLNLEPTLNLTLTLDETAHTTSSSLWCGLQEGTIAIPCAVVHVAGLRLSMALSLENKTSKPVRVRIEPGSIFEHSRWIDRQCVAVCRGRWVDLPPATRAGDTGEQVTVSVPCFGLQSILPLPINGEAMSLAPFRIPRELRMVLTTQGTLWKHFDTFSKAKGVAAAKAKASKKERAKKGSAAGTKAKVQHKVSAKKPK